MNLSTIKSEMAETDIDLYADVDDDSTSLSSVSFSGTITDLLMARVGKMMERGRLMRSSGKKQKRGFIKKVNCVQFRAARVRACVRPRLAF